MQVPTVVALGPTACMAKVPTARMAKACMAKLPMVVASVPTACMAKVPTARMAKARMERILTHMDSAAHMDQVVAFMVLGLVRTATQARMELACMAAAQCMEVARMVAMPVRQPPCQALSEPVSLARSKPASAHFPL